MLEPHDIASLVDTARDALRQELLDALPADKRHTALMIANALSVASRYVAAASSATSLASDNAALAAALRGLEGKAAAEGRLHAELLAHTRAELAIANPKALAR